LGLHPIGGGKVTTSDIVYLCNLKKKLFSKLLFS